jgi:hypothetical protein
MLERLSMDISHRLPTVGRQSPGGRGQEHQGGSTGLALRWTGPLRLGRAVHAGVVAPLLVTTAGMKSPVSCTGLRRLEHSRLVCGFGPSSVAITPWEPQ